MLELEMEMTTGRYLPSFFCLSICLSPPLPLFSLYMCITFSLFIDISLSIYLSHTHEHTLMDAHINKLTKFLISLSFISLLFSFIPCLVTFRPCVIFPSVFLSHLNPFSLSYVVATRA